MAYTPLSGNQARVPLVKGARGAVDVAIVYYIAGSCSPCWIQQVGRVVGTAQNSAARRDQRADDMLCDILYSSSIHCMQVLLLYVLT